MIYICKLISPLSTGISAGDIEEGKLVSLNEGGVPVQFYMAKQDYESGLNGAGRTLLVRKDVYDQRQWNSSNVNAWADSDLLTWLNGTYKALLPPEIQAAMGTTTYYYTPGSGNNTVTTRTDSVFQLSLTELGESFPHVNEEGTALPISNLLRVAYLNGNTNTQWTRSLRTSSSVSIIYLDSEGNVISSSPNSTHGSRPCFTLPADFKFKESEVS